MLQCVIPTLDSVQWLRCQVWQLQQRSCLFELETGPESELAAAAAANCIVPGELEDIEQTAVQVPEEVRCSVVWLGCGLEEVGLRCTAV